jgi:D-serine deaminase-like pyridoxal phosphate-dependent protein
MPISWLTVLQAVPWSDVIRNAPKVADGAKKLWSTVAGQPAQAPVDAGTPARSRDDPSPEVLQARIDALDATVADLHGQLLASAELIRELAEQNTQMVRRVELNRVRAVRLTWALAVVALVAVAGVIW